MSCYSLLCETACLLKTECALLEKNSFGRDRFDVDVPGGPVLQESKFTASGISYNVKMHSPSVVMFILCKNAFNTYT